MKLFVTALAVSLALCAFAEGRPVKRWSAKELWERSDAVVLAAPDNVLKTEEAGQIQLGNSPPLPTVTYKAALSVKYTLKGEEVETIEFRYAPLDSTKLGGGPIVNGPGRIWLEQGAIYVFYLRSQTKNGETYFVGVLEGEFDDDQAVVLVAPQGTERFAPPAEAGPEAGQEQKDLSVREMLIRHAISAQTKVTLWFIDDGERKDPPADFLKRFADLKVSVRGVSEAKIEGGVVSDPKTGEEGWIITTRIARWIEDTTAEVEYEAYHAGMAARGQKGVARLKEGKWVFEAKELWVS